MAPVGGGVKMLLPFSIPEHVPLLLSGAKKQTTRQPRKRPLKVGDILHAFGWNGAEIQSYKELVCSEEISPSCEGCSKTDEDLDNCLQDLKGDL